MVNRAFRPGVVVVACGPKRLRREEERLMEHPVPGIGKEFKEEDDGPRREGGEGS